MKLEKNPLSGGLVETVISLLYFAGGAAGSPKDAYAFLCCKNMLAYTKLIG